MFVNRMENAIYSLTKKPHGSTDLFSIWKHKHVDQQADRFIGHLRFIFPYWEQSGFLDLRRKMRFDGFKLLPHYYQLLLSTSSGPFEEVAFNISPFVSQFKKDE